MATLRITVEVDVDPTLIDPEEITQEIVDIVDENNRFVTEPIQLGTATGEWV